MSKVTKPVVLDETAKQVVAQMQLQNEILTSLASGINYKPTSIKDGHRNGAEIRCTA